MIPAKSAWRALLLLANQARNGEANNVIRNIDQEGLAQMIGTTRSRVNHFMNKFRRLHYIGATLPIGCITSARDGCG